jgi:hypothetical protein
MGLGRQQGFSGAAVETTLTSAINSSALTFAVASVAGWPSSGLPFTVTLDQGNETLQETVLVDSYSGTTVTLDTLLGRGYDGTTAQNHAEDAPVVHTLDAAFCADVSARLFVPTTKGDMVYVSTTTGVVMSRLPISATEYQVIGAGSSGVPAYQDSSKSILSATGDMLIASGSHALTRLPIGTTGYVLTVVSGSPAWAASTSSVVTTAGDLIVGTGAGTVTRLGKGSNGQILSMVAGALAWAAPTPSGLQPIAKSSGYTAASFDFAVASAALTVTSPTAAEGATFGATANYAASNASPVTLTAASGHIIGPGIPASTTSIILGAQNAFVVLVSDGTNWFVCEGAQDSGWITPALGNSWVGANPPNPQYRLIGNRVQLRGQMSGGSTNTTAWTMPSGFYDPTQSTYIPAVATGASFPTFLILGPNTVAPVFAGTLSFFILDGISFLVD